MPWHARDLQIKYMWFRRGRLLFASTHVPHSTLWRRTMSANRTRTCVNQKPVRHGCVIRTFAAENLFARMLFGRSKQTATRRLAGRSVHVFGFASAARAGMLGTTMCVYELEIYLLIWFPLYFRASTRSPARQAPFPFDAARVANNSITTNSNCFFSSFYKNIVFISCLRSS